MSETYFSLYSQLVVGASLLDLGFRAYSLKVHQDDSIAKIGLASSRTLQNISCMIPLNWTGYALWQIMNELHSSKIYAAVSVALPLAFGNYIFAGVGLNPLFAIGPRGPGKDLTAHFTPYICNCFRTLNIAIISITFRAGKISPLSRSLAISACLITMVAQHYLDS